MSIHVAYLAAGRLHLKRGNEPVRVIESKFGQNIRERALQIQRRNAWKTEGRGAQFQSGGLLWGMPERDPAEMRIAITSVSRGRNAGELLYSLDTDDIGGMFAVKDWGAEEQRIFHSSERRVRDLCTAPGQEQIACSVVSEFGTGHIGVRPIDGSQITEITEGDSLDLCPRWVPGAKNQIVFQSAGVGRDPNGVVLGHGPFAVHKLDVETGQMTSLAEDEGHDLLAPQIDHAGNLWFIRRPYALAQRPSPWRTLKDVLLIPFRVLHTLFQWINFRSIAYTGQPLNSTGDAREQRMDIKRMMIWGNLIDAERAMRDGRRDGSKAPALVPKTWELVRHAPDGKEETIARSVISFDLCEDGSLIFSNGSAIYHRQPTGQSEELLVDRYIEQVIAVGS